ncbi:AbrB/MazE/SpoVT family DNA-binding domain-containing protein [Bifidobacterium miconisargentati]|uniref:AbrB/MazE/SpoVT family DNA-binding domain-containing protein n=1 Tax=Bifidobacterium miconisargentati TaxID=2834437 RepID=UPI001BDBC1F6|nr:AbrB/MazE/SpoVT family DNA-binding domain-containing protein [Bifidobacterium miconisargentati]MBW3089536.1 AbrB/MazE/SpoVT family DNA-binding domain-containing protein [Bifidobacterium miconisargentati]
MSMVMNMAKVTAKGQITIPADVREAIGIREGDKVLFVRMDDGSISLRNSSLEALQRAQRSFSGAATEAGLQDEDDLTALIKQVRSERAKQGSGPCE